MKKKAGLAIFLFGMIWSIAWGIVVSISCTNSINTLTLDQLNETAWSLTGPLMMLWGIGGVPLGVVVSGMGLLLYTNSKGSITLLYTIGTILIIFLALASGSLVLYPILFGLGGTIILLSFFGILWYWARERKTVEGKLVRSFDLKLVGYVFLLIATWFTCGLGGQLLGKAFEGYDHSPPLHVMIFFVLGWLFLLLSYSVNRLEK